MVGKNGHNGHVQAVPKGLEHLLQLPLHRLFTRDGFFGSKSGVISKKIARLTGGVYDFSSMPESTLQGLESQLDQFLTDSAVENAVVARYVINMPPANYNRLSEQHKDVLRSAKASAWGFMQSGMPFVASSELYPAIVHSFDGKANQAYRPNLHEVLKTYSLKLEAIRAILFVEHYLANYKTHKADIAFNERHPEIRHLMLLHQAVVVPILSNGVASQTDKALFPSMQQCAEELARIGIKSGRCGDAVGPWRKTYDSYLAALDKLSPAAMDGIRHSIVDLVAGRK